MATGRLGIATVALALGCNRDPVTQGDAQDPYAFREARYGKQPGPEDRSPPVVPGVLRVADIAADPRRYDGHFVTVVGRLDQVRAELAFTLDDDAPLRGGVDQDLLVMGRASQLAPMYDQWRHDLVRVTGVVRLLGVRELEAEVGWDLDPTLEAEIVGLRPVLVARTIEPAAERS